jgi:hypothetical protein
MAEVNVLADHQTFDLMEHRRVGGIAIAAIDAARRDDAQGWLPPAASIARICTGLVWVRSTICALPLGQADRRCHASRAPDGSRAC